MDYLIIKVTAVETPPPGAGVNTVIGTVPAKVMSEARITAVNRTAETKVVVRSDPFHRMTESVANPVPSTLRVNAFPPCVIVDGLRLVIVGTGGSVIVNSSELDCAPPVADVDTVIGTVPAKAMSDAGIAALNRVAETNVVVRFDPFQRTT